MRRLGARVGRRVRFGRRAFVLCRRYEDTFIGDGTKLGDRTLITVGSLQTGEDVRFDSEVRVRGRGSLRVGNGCYVGAHSYIDVNCDVVLEDDAGVGPGSWIFTHSVWQSVLEGGPRRFAPVRIQRQAWIPACVFIMPGVTIGENAIVGARSLVVSDIPPGVLAAGTPARVLKTAEERKAERPDPDARKEIAAKVLEEFAKIAIERRVAESFDFKPGTGVQIYKFEARGRTKAILAYCPGRLSTSQLATAEASTWVALDGVDSEAIERLGKRAWFDVEARKRSDNWDSFNELLHEVFRGEFGVRFRVAK